MIKKLVYSLFFMLILLAVSHQTASAGELKKIVVGVNDSLIDLEKSSYIMNNTAYTPMDLFLKELGTEISYDDLNMAITAKKNGKALIFYLQENKIITSDGEIKLDLMTEIDGVQHIPTRLVGEYFGFQVEQIDKYKMVRIYNEDHILSHDTFFEFHREKIEQYITIKPDRVVYLTFDDGPNQYTAQILDILKDKNATATFFMLEGNMKQYPEVVKRMVDEGNYPGLHGVSHDVNKLYKGNPQNLTIEMEQTRTTLLDITGFDSQLTRVPYGSKPYMTDSFRDNLAGSGYKMWDWTIDTEDWRYKRKEPERIVTNLKSGLSKLENQEKPVVILLHDSKATASVLPEIIDYVREKGYEPVSYNPEKHEKVNFWDDSRL